MPEEKGRETRFSHSVNAHVPFQEQIAYLLGSLSLNLVGWLGVGAILLSLLFQVRATTSPPQPVTAPIPAMTDDEDPLEFFFAER
jgi:hypothetical protein